MSREEADKTSGVDRSAMTVAAGGPVSPASKDSSPFATIKDVSGWSGFGDREGSEVVHRYELVREIGRGGMGLVYLARDQHTARWVAIKRPNSRAAEDRLAFERFMSEAGSIARAQHIYIVHMYDYSRDPTDPYIVMEYVAGPDDTPRPADWPADAPAPPLTLFDQIRRRGSMTVLQAASLGEKLCRALVCAHNNGLVHRDIKPGNVLIDREGNPKLLDFGIAATVRRPADSHLTIAGATLGSPDFMAPEQEIDAGAATATSDVFSVAATIWYALSGESARFFRESRVPPRLRVILERAMEKDPARRTRDAVTLGVALERIVHRASPADDETLPADSWRCMNPECGDPNPNSVRYCHTCGLDSLERCPRCGDEGRRGNPHCGKCGTRIARYREIANSIASIKLLRGMGFLDAASRLIGRALADRVPDGEQSVQIADLQARLTKEVDRRAPVLSELKSAVSTSSAAGVCRALASEIRGLSPAPDPAASPPSLQGLLDSDFDDDRQYAALCTDTLNEARSILTAAIADARERGRLDEWLHWAQVHDGLFEPAEPLAAEPSQKLEESKRRFEAIRSTVAALLEMIDRALRTSAEQDSSKPPQIAAPDWESLPHGLAAGHVPLRSIAFYDAIVKNATDLSGVYSGFAAPGQVQKTVADAHRLRDRVQDLLERYEARSIRSREFFTLLALLPDEPRLPRVREERNEVFRGRLLESPTDDIREAYLLLRSSEQFDRDLRRELAVQWCWYGISAGTAALLASFAAGWLAPFLTWNWRDLDRSKYLVAPVCWLITLAISAACSVAAGALFHDAFTDPSRGRYTVPQRRRMVAIAMIGFCCWAALQLVFLCWPGYLVRIVAVAVLGSALVAWERFVHRMPKSAVGDAVMVRLTAVATSLCSTIFLCVLSARTREFSWLACFASMATACVLACLPSVRANIVCDIAARAKSCTESHGVRSFLSSWR